VAGQKTLPQAKTGTHGGGREMVRDLE